MKKIVLVALVAATSAFGMTNGKSMVELSDCFDNNSCSNFNLNWSKDDATAEEESTTFAINYNYLFTGHFGAGINLATNTSTTDGDVTTVGSANSTTYGINLFWNISEGWEGQYVALRYNMQSQEDSDTTTAEGDDVTLTTLEYGARISMGKIWGMSAMYNPSVSYSMQDEDNADLKTDSLALNLVNFALTF